MPDYNETELSFIATIETGWHMYSQFLPEGGPVVTTFKYEKNAAVLIPGKVTEPKVVEEFDKNFNMKLKFFFSKAVFTQKIKVNAARTTLKGTIEFMSCDDSQCTPPQEQDFKFSLKGVSNAALSTTSKSGLQQVQLPQSGVTAIPVTAQQSASQISVVKNRFFIR